MKKKSINKFINKFAELHINYQNKQFKLIKYLSDENLEVLAKAFDKQALGGENKTCFGFRVECWDVFANNIRTELRMRNGFKLAKESGLDCYCLTCHGKCLGEDEHDKLVISLTTDEMQINEMSVTELRKELLRLRNLKQ